MHIVYINPNSTASMTDAVVCAAREAAPDLAVTGLTNVAGPPAIEGPEDGAAAVPGVMALLPEARAQGADAIVIACFDDTGLDQVRAAAGCPVLGIGQSAFVMAGLLGVRWSVVTSLAVSVPVIRGNIEALGLGANCVSVRASGLPVLTIDEGSDATRAHLAAEFRRARAEDGAQAVVLGCAGMAALRRNLADRSNMLLIDGVQASIFLARAAAGFVTAAA